MAFRADTLARMRLGWLACVYALAIAFSSISLRWHNNFASHIPLPPCIVVAALLASSVKVGDSCNAIAQHLRAATWRFPVALGALYFVAASVIFYGPFEGIPNVEDGYAYYLQAKIFSTGRLFLPDIGSDHLAIPWVYRHGGRIFAIFPPGFSALCAPGFWIGHPMLFPALFGALGLIATYLFVRELSGPLFAGISTLLCAASPSYLAMGGSFLSHTALVASVMWGGYFFLRAVREPRSYRSAVASGALFGLAILTRPIDGALVLAVLFALGVISRKSAHKTACTTGSVATLSIIALTASWGGIATSCWYKFVQLGTLFGPPAELAGNILRVGFGPEIGMIWQDTFPTVGHTPWRGILNANYQANVFNSEAFGWPIPSLTFALLAMVFRQRERSVRIATAVVVGLLTCVVFGWYHGVCVGARYLFVLVPFVALLTVEGLALTMATLDRLRVPRHASRRFFFALLVVFECTAVGLYLPGEYLIAPYVRLRRFHSELVRRVMGSTGASPELVFIRAPFPLASPVLVQNRIPLGDDGSPLYFIDLGPEKNEPILRQFPERSVRFVSFAPAERPPLWRWLDRMEMKEMLPP